MIHIKDTKTNKNIKDAIAKLKIKTSEETFISEAVNCYIDYSRKHRYL